jgi:hypothetical protein
MAKIEQFPAKRGARFTTKRTQGRNTHLMTARAAAIATFLSLVFRAGLPPFKQASDLANMPSNIGVWDQTTEMPARDLSRITFTLEPGFIWNGAVSMTEPDNLGQKIHALQQWQRAAWQQLADPMVTTFDRREIRNQNQTE